MLIAFVESRPKLGAKVEEWEDVLLTRQEMLVPPQLGWVVRIPDPHGGIRRYRVREVSQDLLPPNHAERVIEQELLVYLVPIPPKAGYEAAVEPPRQRSMFEGNGGGTLAFQAAAH